MLFPKKMKYRKQFKFKGKFSRIDFSKNATTINIGVCGLQALENGRLTPKQIEALRRTIVKKLMKKGIIKICIFCDLNISRKPAEVRMGNGKGSFKHWSCNIKKGRVLFQVLCFDTSKGIIALETAIKKVSIKTRVIDN